MTVSNNGTQSTSTSGDYFAVQTSSSPSGPVFYVTEYFRYPSVTSGGPCSYVVVNTSNETLSWVNPSAHTHLANVSDVDDGYEVVSLSFNFSYYCVSFARVAVNSNGCLHFNLPAYRSGMATNIPPVWQNSICPFWADL